MEEILSAIEEADLVLVGLGEEFDEIGMDKTDRGYIAARNYLEENENGWMLPQLDEIYRRRNNITGESVLEEGLNNLAKILADKNYFVVSTAMNERISAVEWKDNRLVMTCGGTGMKQCPEGCGAGLHKITEAEEQALVDYLSRLQECLQNPDCKQKNIDSLPQIGVCPDCGKALQLNNIYAGQYDENGYLPQWQLYTKWLQGTLNKNLVILELGVGMKFPSVIRWPFEKIAFFNNKAHIYRVNEKLYQLTEELKGKGTAIPKNSIDWLRSLC